MPTLFIESVALSVILTLIAYVGCVIYHEVVSSLSAPIYLEDPR